MARRRAARLSATFVKNIAREGRYGDGHGGFGLSLWVEPMKNGRWSKTWSQRLRIRGELVQRGLGKGSYPLVSLAMARDVARDNAERVAQGEDIRQPEQKMPKFAEFFDEVIALRSPRWTSSRTMVWWLTAKECYRPIWHKSVADVTTADALRPIKPLWHDHNKKAREVLSILSTVMKWAVAEGYRTTNPAGREHTYALGKVQAAEHHRSLPPGELGQALAQIRDCDAWWAVKACLLFLALTGVRSGEARGATWDEFDLEKAVWTVPASRMKNREEHRVPLSTEAVALLAYALEQGGGEGLVFPAERGGAFSDGTSLSGLLLKLDIGCVPHGFRSSFSNWAGGLGIPDAVSEMVLSHKPSSAIVKVYRTSDFFEQRVPVMQQWAEYLTKKIGSVVPGTADASARAE